MWNESIGIGTIWLKIKRSDTNAQDVMDMPFSIAPPPQNVRVVQACPNFLKLKWDAVELNPVSNTVHYEIFLLGEKYMALIGTTANTEFNVPTIQQDPTNDHWMAVRTVGQGQLRSERTIAIHYQGGLMNCVQPNDLALVNVVAPGEETIFGCGYAEIPVVATVKNNGILSQTNVTVAYQLNNEPPVIETIPGIIQPGQIKIYTFNTPLFVIGSEKMNLKVFTQLPADGATFNDGKEVNFCTSLFPGNGQSIDYFEDLEGAIFPPPFYTIDNPDKNITWEKRTVMGMENIWTNAFFINNYSYAHIGEKDAFITLPVDLENTNNPTLRFDVSYARYNANYSDTLTIEISTDCGQTFSEIIYKKGGVNLATAEDHNQLFAPASREEWRQENISLHDYSGQSVVFRFTNITGYGNSLFIDNINVFEASLPTAHFSVSATEVCVGESIGFTNLSTGSNLSYNWTFGANAQPAQSTETEPGEVIFSEPGTYMVVLLASNQSGTSSFSQIVSVREEPVSIFNYELNGQEVVFSNFSSFAESYLWDFGDGNYSTQFSPIHLYTSAGIYEVLLQVKNACGTSLSPPTVINLLINAIEPAPDKINPVLFPNPNNGQFKLLFNAKETDNYYLKINNVHAQDLFSKNIKVEAGPTEIPVSISNLIPGIYFLEIVGTHDNWLLKFIVK